LDFSSLCNNKTAAVHPKPKNIPSVAWLVDEETKSQISYHNVKNLALDVYMKARHSSEDPKWQNTEGVRNGDTCARRPPSTTSWTKYLKKSPLMMGTLFTAPRLQLACP
jgi:hypothetical protein